MTKQIRVGSVPIGGGAPIVIQSMLNTATTDVEGSLAQIAALKQAGCEIARLAVPDMEAAKGFAQIAAASPLPLVADIHFDYRLAIAAAEGGASKIRINPGNIGSRDKTREVVIAAKERSVPIRIGVNSGSLEEDILKKYGVKTVELGVQSLDDKVLSLAKRGHTAKNSLEAVRLIQQAGLEPGMQMMCGLPGDTREKDIETAKIINIQTIDLMPFFDFFLRFLKALGCSSVSATVKPLPITYSSSWKLLFKLSLILNSVIKTSLHF